MRGQIEGRTKMDIASEVLATTVTNLSEKQKVGLVAYGHRKRRRCNDVEFLVNQETGSKSDVISALKQLQPTGRTPLAYSASQVIDNLRTTNTRATIILITDGIESCRGNICEVVQFAKKEGIEFKLHIIGFGLKSEETNQLRCAASKGEGNYYDAFDTGELSKVLYDATSETVDKPDGNLGVYTEKNQRPTDGLVRVFSSETDTEIAQGRTFGDTTYLKVPAGIYNLKVYPSEDSQVTPIQVLNVEVFDEGLVTKSVSFDSGNISMYISNNQKDWESITRVYDTDGNEVANARSYGKPAIIEINPGTYCIEVTALNIRGATIKETFDNVEVNSNETALFTHNFNSGKAIVGVHSGNTLIDATLTFKNISSGEIVYVSRTYTTEANNPREFNLNPGRYEVTATVVSGKFSRRKEIFTLDIKEGEIVTENINLF
ncbi:hypothetical protein GCM10008083_32270 [Ulvibacter litoralis]|nr:hypothetical protein GCM10008083_32270 [Ulvibacter litoralis]